MGVVLGRCCLRPEGLRGIWSEGGGGGAWECEVWCARRCPRYCALRKRLPPFCHRSAFALVWLFLITHFRLYVSSRRLARATRQDRIYIYLLFFSSESRATRRFYRHCCQCSAEHLVRNRDGDSAWISYLLGFLSGEERILHEPQLSGSWIYIYIYS